MTARAALGVGGAMRESEGFITEASVDFWCESSYNYVLTKNEKGVYLARPSQINLACEGGQMSYPILTDSPTKLQPNNTNGAAFVEGAV